MEMRDLNSTNRSPANICIRRLLTSTRVSGTPEGLWLLSRLRVSFLVLPGKVIVQFPKGRLAAKQLLGTVELHQSAFPEQGNLVKVQDGIEIMRDGDEGAILEFLFNNAEHELFGLDVDAIERSVL